MIKNIEWLKKEIGELPCVDTVFNSGGSSYIDSAVQVMAVYDLLDQLDEPEANSQIDKLAYFIMSEVEGEPSQNQGAVDTAIRIIKSYQNQETLSQEWINKNKREWTNIQGTKEYVSVDKLQGILVPKQELPVIPKFVAEFLIGKEDYRLHELFDDVWLYKEHNRVAEWLYDNDELTNKQREIDLVMARDRGYLVEEEQKYRVIDRHEVHLLAKEEGRNKVETVAELVEIYGHEHVDIDYNLTEQEIKDYDPRYWAFAKPLEEEEE